MDNESQYSGYSYRSSHSHSSRKHRDRRDKHRSKSRESSRTQKAGNAQGQGAPLLDDNWGDNTTAITGTSERSISHDDVWRTCEELRPSPVQPRLCRRCQRAWAVTLSCVLGLLALLSPLAFLLLPRLLWHEALAPCAELCEGLYLSLALKLLLLALSSWALFFQPARRALLPRLFLLRCLVQTLVFLCVACYWLVYGVRVLWQREPEYRGIVGYAVSCVDTLMFVQYLSLLLLEVVHLQTAFCVKVTRSTDGVSHFYNMGRLSIQRAAVWVLSHYYRDFPIHNSNLPNLAKSILARKMTGFKLYSLEEENSTSNCTGPPQAVMAAAVARRRNCHSELYYEQADYERRVRKRKARLVMAVEEAFAQVKRLEEGEAVVPSPKRKQGILDPREAAQAIFAPMARALQKYLRTTKQQQCHSMENILTHLQFCLTHNMSPQAFLEHYLSAGPTLQYQGEANRVRECEWTLVSELPVTTVLRGGVVFSLRRPHFSLVVSVVPLPFLQLGEEYIDPKSHKFELKLQSETSV
ncbi:vang-like protein 2 [Denticeps clupeoides]|uniref:Vang-like protein n=1 Tax=Denticeps clupeoides TaxID=299321 RepID=A0AAY4BR69_9TELE|nr:vang-like protein 2 [Denticeps clupeoides]XP_028832853.1 vang-like protein 2 [Denticeps clupeoides]